MKRGSTRTVALIVVAMFLLGCTQMSAMMNDGWVTLIDGAQGLDNWNRVGHGNWRAEGGAIVADGKVGGKDNGYLVSKKAYRDFQIHAEFWASDDANSGIFMRCADPQKITDKSCYEANIFDQRKDQTYATGGIVHHAPVKSPIKAGGKWNTYDITVRGSHLLVVLNGTKTADVNNSQHASGPFALQYGTGVVKFRKVRIKEL